MMSPNAAASSPREPASAGMISDDLRAQGHVKRNSLFYDAIDSNRINLKWP
jgi:hypothetical protein